MKTYLVTGATGAIGSAIAEDLALEPNRKVVCVARDGEKGARLEEKLRRKTGNPNFVFEQADLSLRESVYKLAERWEGPLHVLINNAAETPRKRETTSEGHERQFATNVLGYCRMMFAFKKILEESAPARIVNVASYWAGGLNLDDLEFNKRSYDNDDAYRQSKQANRMLTVAYAREFEPLGITVNACHPGDVNSKLSNDLGFGGSQSPEEGARTPVFLATLPSLTGVSGKYFVGEMQRDCEFSRDTASIQKLFNICVELS